MKLRTLNMKPNSGYDLCDRMSIDIRRLYCYACRTFFDNSESFNSHRHSHNAKVDPTETLRLSRTQLNVKQEGEEICHWNWNSKEWSRWTNADDDHCNGRDRPPSNSQYVNAGQVNQEFCYDSQNSIKVQCLVCSKVFTTISSLVHHINTSTKPSTTFCDKEQVKSVNSFPICVRTRMNQPSNPLNSTDFSPSQNPSVVLQDTLNCDNYSQSSSQSHLDCLDVEVKNSNGQDNDDDSDPGQEMDSLTDDDEYHPSDNEKLREYRKKVKSKLSKLKLTNKLISRSKFQKSKSRNFGSALGQEKTHVKSKACPLCPSTFNLKVGLQSHMEAVHPGQKIFKCTMSEECQMSFWKPSGVRRHILRCHETNEHFKCSKCSESFQGSKLYTQHLRTHTVKSKKLNTISSKRIGNPCPLCPKNNVDEGSQLFRNKFHLVNHISKHHPGQKLFKCHYPDCDRAYWTQHPLKKHELTHEGPSMYPHKCTFENCQKSFVYAWQLTIHVRSHTGETPYLCTKCGVTFTNSKAFNHHMRAHDDRFQCPTCGKIFNVKANLDRHIQIHLGVKRYLCSVCAKSFTQKVQLDCHMVTLHSQDYKFPCQVPGCAKKFKLRPLLNQHVKWYHNPSSVDTRTLQPLSKLNCTVPGCSKQFKNASQLRQHLKSRNHCQPKENMSCFECGKIFPGEHRLNQHISVVHRQGEFECPTCGKLLANPHSLTIHLRTHEKYPPGIKFKCSICPKEFREQRYLTRHFRNHQAKGQAD